MKRIITFAVMIAAAFTLAFTLYGETQPELMVFTRPACGRCTYTVDFLKKNNIKYTEYSTSETENRTKMWEIVRASGKYKNGSISMPVVVIKGEVFINIPDMQEFTGSIASLIAGRSTPVIEGENKTDSSDPFINSIRERHNYYRKNHNTPGLKWNPVIQQYAQAWADKLAAEDRMYHRQPNKYGENIYWISGGEVDGSSVVDSWYSEIKYYNYKNPGFGMSTGHFTQVVWSGSTELGCGKSRSKRGGTYVVCNYNPPGNYMGMFDKNVLPVSDKRSGN